MSWNYNTSDIAAVGTFPPHANPVARTAAPTVDLSNPENVTREANALSAQIPAQFAALLNDTGIEPAQKLELVKELVQLNQSPQLSEQDVASASPAIREAVSAMKDHKAAIAAQERELLGMVVAPLALSAAPAALQAPSAPLAPPVSERREATLGEALAFIEARGPDATPGMGAARNLGRS